MSKVCVCCAARCFFKIARAKIADVYRAKWATLCLDRWHGMALLKNSASIIICKWNFVCSDFFFYPFKGDYNAINRFLWGSALRRLRIKCGTPIDFDKIDNLKEGHVSVEEVLEVVSYNVLPEIFDCKFVCKRDKSPLDHSFSPKIFLDLCSQLELFIMWRL